MNPVAERRHVTVLFAHCPGLEEIDPPLPFEARRERLERVLLRARAAVEREGGAVDKTIGDGLMAVFGAPVAHEDDPVRAAIAALAMARDPELAALGLRAGINTGEVLWGTVAGDRPTAIGDPVNVAARLASAAAAGEILASGAVRDAAFRKVRFDPLPPVRLKGRAAAVDLYRAVDVIAEPAEYRRPWDPAAVMVGRGAELELLEETVLTGRGGAVWLTGEAGTGKSRLAYEFRRLLRARGGTFVAVGRASLGPGVALSAFADLLRGAAAGVPLREWLPRSLGEPGNDAAEAAAELIALSIGEPWTGAVGRDADPAQRASRTTDAWAGWIARHTPAVLFLDDAELFDPATRALLESLVVRLRGSAVTFVCGARSGASAPGGFRTVTLGPLGPDDACELARALFGSLPSAPLRTFLHEQTGGNPYTLEQLCRYLKAAGLVGGSPLALTGRPERMPHGLQGLLVARLDALPPAGKETIKAIAALGRIGWAGITGALLGRDARPELDALADEGLLVRAAASTLDGDSEYAFRQALLRDAAYSLLPRRDRARLHATAAGALESRGDGSRSLALAAGQRERQFEALAAGTPDSAEAKSEACRAWIASARTALDEGAMIEALAGAEAAVRLEAGPEAQVLRAQALIGLARPGAAAEAARAARSGPATPPAVFARAGVALAQALHRQGKIAEALAEADAALAGAVGEARAHAVYARAAALSTLARWDEALAACASFPPPAPDDSREIVSIRAQLGIVRGYILSRRGDAATAMAEFEETLQAARGARNLSALAGTWNGLGLCDEDLGDPGRASRCYEIALALRRRTGERSGEGAVLNNLGNLRRKEGKPEEALGCYERAFGIAEEAGDRLSEASTLINIGLTEVSLGRAADARETFHRALERKRESGDRRGVAVCLTNLAHAWIDLGDLASARSCAEEALAIRRDIREERGLAFTLHALATIERLAGNGDAARRAAEEALAAARRVGVLDLVSQGLLTAMECVPDPAERRRLAAAVEALPPHGQRAWAISEAARIEGLGLARTAPGEALQRLAGVTAGEGNGQAALARAVALAALGNREGALRELATVRPPATPFGRLQALETELLARRLLGDTDGAARVLAEGVALAESLRVPARRWALEAGP